MKRVLLIIVSFLFCTIVYAKSTYTQAQDLANDYIKKFPNYQKYMVTKNADYGFSTANSLVNSSSYKTGGLINEQEYKISTGSRNSSYLFNGLSFFTMTESGNQVKIIDPKVANGINSQNKSSALSGVRVTGFVSGEIQLRGNGTRVSPWKFIERYNVRFDYDDTKIKVSPSTTTVSNGGWAKVNVTPTIQYTYVPQTTCGIIENDILTVTGITSDTVCKIETALREYTVNIDARGGTFSDTMHTSLEWDLLEGNTKATKKVIYSNKVGNLPTGDHVSRVGYTFDGVFEDNTAINSNSLIKKDTNLTIRWKGNKYRVTYNTNGGSITPTYVELIYGDPYIGLHTPSKTGYTFKGWYKDSALTKQIIIDETILDTASDHTIYAKWEANKYTVTFDANGGSVSPSTKKVTYDSTYGTLPTPTKSGYTFDGWYKETSFKSKVLASDTVKITTDTTLHAKWLQNVSLPVATTYCDSKTYNGLNQTIVKTAGEGFTWKSGTSQKDAGSYTVTAAIKAGYIWADGTTADKTISCSIAKLTTTMSLGASSGTLTYGSNRSVAITTNGDGAISCSSSNSSVATCSVSGKTLTITPVANTADGKTATITVSQAGTTNSTSASKTFAATVNRAKLTCPSSPADRAYTGNTYSSGITCPTGSTTSGTTSSSSAGTHTVTCTANSGYVFNGANPCLVRWNITKKTGSVTLSKSSVTVTYGGGSSYNVASITATGDGTLSCSSSNTSVATCSINGTQLNVAPKALSSDGVTATITVTMSAGTNYGSSSASLTAIVNRNVLLCPSSPSDKLYTGSSQNSGITCPAGSTASGDTTGTAAKTYTQTCKASVGQKFESACNVNWKIIIKSLTCPSSPSDKTYTGNTYQSGITCPTGSTAGGTTSASSVGTHTQTCTANTGYTFGGTCSVTWKINARSLTCPSSPADKNYNGSSQSSGISCPSGSSAGGTTSATAVGTYSQTCTPNSGYTFGGTCSVSWKIKTTMLTCPGSPAARTYTGNTYQSGITCPTGSTTGGTTSASSAGTHTVTCTAKTGYSFSVNPCRVNWVINPKTLTCPSSPAAKTYTGKSQASGITCPSGSTAGGTTSATNVGTYYHTCTANTNYAFSGTCSVSWKINDKSCASGYHSLLQDDEVYCVIDCAAGTHIATANSSSCVACGKGTFITKNTTVYGGKTSCKQCDPGTYQDATGQSSCKTCPGNKTSNRGATSSSSCYYICNVSNCRTCSGNNYCGTCNSGYSQSGGKCNMNCSVSNCRSCSSPNYCSSCNSGYTLSGGTCKKSGGGTGNCFPAGTKVMTKYGLRDIESITDGTIVLTYNEKTGKQEYNRVKHHIVLNNPDEVLYTLKLDDNSTLKITHLHKVYTIRDDETSYISAENLRVGDKVLYANGTIHEIKMILSEDYDKPVYNLEVENTHNFYVGNNPILVHNIRIYLLAIVKD